MLKLIRKNLTPILLTVILGLQVVYTIDNQNMKF